ncbi:hypothetical protein FHR81_005379 [Actinoalloteichus hoggarensis]|uniref:Uncharacterized protein n=1 Tax=Actinoalloteichus hoggarensis TaxID=1470176 RepID=A0A221VWG5_9PSEU|nr:hypothetical protein [Actinoalloteichus hoggarensis]ASO17890.1 hypothetical protein AHOG_01115 [Actinoalloteichus hoggarensis]MBB5924302.1 hypothetical protein [Actinoalloteichus hoggarensis]
MAPRPRRGLAGAVLALLAGGFLAACGSGSDARPVSDADADAGSGTRTSATFAGRVETVSGEAVPGCLITPESVDGAVEIPELAVFSDADGAFAWTLPSGTYTFSTTCDSEAHPDASADHDSLSGTSDAVRAEKAETASVTIVVA